MFSLLLYLKLQSLVNFPHTFLKIYCKIFVDPLINFLKLLFIIIVKITKLLKYFFNLDYNNLSWILFYYILLKIFKIVILN